jgi:DNA-binding transcriptional MerR regulator
MKDGPPIRGDIPDKLYFKIGEVSDVVGLPAYVLRFWESEFKRIQPKRTAAGQRLYRKKDIELILKIKDLLYNKKFTIPGARHLLQSGSDPSDPDPPPNTLLEEVRMELLSIRKLLE